MIIKADYPSELENKLTAAGNKVRKCFEQAEKDRATTELRWIDDLRQYKGQYPEGFFNDLSDTMSRVFVKETRKKTKTIAASLRDILFPSGKEKNWAISPTKEPRLHPMDIVDINKAAALAEQAGVGADFDPAALAREIAKERAENMEMRITDQLQEQRYAEVVGQEVINSGAKYGTGVFKGPITQKVKTPEWQVDESGEWGQESNTRRVPHIESVPIWDIYPDMGVTDIRAVRFIIQRHKMQRGDVLEMVKSGGFDSKTLHEYLSAVPNGDYIAASYQAQLDVVGDANGNSGKGFYEIIEYWGELTADELRECGCDGISDDDLGSYWAEIWVAGPFVIRSVISPFDQPGRRHPYYFFYMDKDETSVFGEGIPSLIRDDQDMLNSATRAMLDNAAITAGFQLDVNADLLDPNEDPRDVRPFKAWIRHGRGAEAQYPAIREIGISSHTNEYMAIIGLGERWGSEHTVPSYMHGQNDPRGAAGTASGLSMLMGQANIELKDLARNFDNGVTKPFLRAMYLWNMDMSNDNSIKGDYDVIPRGSTSLVAKELRSRSLDMFAASTANPMDLPYIDRHELLLRRAEAHEIVDGVVLDKKTVEDRRQQATKQPNPEQMLELQKQQADAAKKAADAGLTTEKTKTERVTRIREHIELALDAGDTDAALALYQELMNEQATITKSGAGEGAANTEQYESANPNAGIPGTIQSGTD